MADLASTRVFGKLTVMHEAIVKANAEIVGNITASKFIGDGSQLTALHWGQLTGAPATATRWPAWGEVTGKPSTFAPTSHTHPLSQITGAGNLAAINTNASTANFLRGDGTWVTPPNTNTTYAEITTAEIDTGTASTARAISGRRIKYAVDTHGLKIGTTASTAKAGNWMPAWADVTGKPTTFTPSTHTHSLSEVTGAGNLAALNTNASTVNFLRGDGTWATPPNTNTTYTEITTAEIDAGTATTLRTITGRRMKYAVDTHGLKIGTTSSTAKAGNWTPSAAEIPNLPASKITSGTFAAARIPTLNQSTTGNAATATRLQTARTINLGGSLDGSASFDGSGNITINSGITRATLTGDPSSTFRADIFGSNQYGIRLIRGITGGGPFTNYSPGLAWSTSDTHGYLTLDYNNAAAKVGAGSGAGVSWSKALVFDDDTRIVNATPNTTSITAGNGLSGGGTLAADRTITLGTPGTITNSTTNSVTATSHTHALTVTKADVGLSNVTNVAQAAATTSITAGNGLSGGGTLAATRTITLGTPGTITNSTTNSVTTTSHTHALTIAKADVGLSNVPNVDATNASNLASGTVPNARMSGLYDGITLKINGANTVFTTPSSGTGSTAGRTVFGLAEFRGSASATVGAIVFIAPNTTTTVMHEMEIAGLLYNQNTVRMTIQGYRTTGAWSAMRKISTGTVDVPVRWGLTPDGKACVILGDATTSWSYPHFSIIRAMFSHTGATDTYCSGWTTGLVTDLTGYTQVSGFIADSPVVGSITGNAATATKLTTARTINGTSFNGTANVVTANWGTARTLSYTGDVTGSASVNGAANIAFAMTLANSGVGAGTYKSVTVDTKGRVTAGADVLTGLVTSSTATGTSNVATTNTNTFLNITEKVGTATASAGTSTQVTGAGTVTVASDTTGKITITGAQSITGNAATATKLATARTIGGVSFNGTANINLPGVNAAGNQSTTGNAATATKLATARTINGVSFDGSANITVADSTKLPLAGGTATGSVSATALGVANNVATTGAGISLYNGAVTGQPSYGLMFAGPVTFGTHGSVTGDWATYFTMSGATTRGWIFKHGTGTAGNVASISGTGVITASSFVGALTGNAATATKLATVITINGVGFDGSANITLPTVNTSGNQTIFGTKTFSGAIVVSTTTNSTSATTGSLQTRGGLGVSGNIYAAGNVTAYSDIRLKKDIERIPDALAKVIQLNGVTYTRKDSGERHTGLIAQEVQKVMPEAVGGDEYLGVAYGNLVGLLVEAIKEQQARIEALERKITV